MDQTLPPEFFDSYDVGATDKAAFEFFFEQTAKEGLQAEPEYTWDQFENGVAPFNEKPTDEVDTLGAYLIPNYNRELTDINEAAPAVPMDESLSEGFIQNLDRSRQEASARVIGIHPTLASPLIYARAIGMGYEKYLDTDIRPDLYITYGAYPTTMRYNYGEGFVVSPVDIGRTLGNLVMTAPRSENTETDDDHVNDWMKATRTTFKMRNHDLMSEPGNIEVVIPAGRRGKRSVRVKPPVQHKEFLPDGGIEYITDHADVDTYIMGVADNLLVDPENIGSEVYVAGIPLPVTIENQGQLRRALVRSAQSVSTDQVQYHVEGINDHRMRLGLDTVTRRLRRRKDDFVPDDGY